MCSMQKSYSDVLSECKLQFYHPLNIDTYNNPSCKMTLDYISSNHWLKEVYYNLKHIIKMQFTFSFLFIEIHNLKKREDHYTREQGAVKNIWVLHVK